MTEGQQIESWKAFLIVLAILALIAGAILLVSKYFIEPKRPSRLIYNNFEFTKREGMWHTQWQRDGQVYDVVLRYNPLEVENVSVSGRLNDTFRRQPFYITFDPDEPAKNFKYLALGVAELGLSLVRAMGAQIVSACTKNLTDACADRPIVTCDDDLAVIYLRTRNETKVRLQGNCLILEGTELELIRAIDRVLYHFYKIMP